MPRPPEKQHRTSVAKTRDILEELFLHPPVSQAELDHRLAPVNLQAARRLLAERLASPELSESDGELLVSLFHALGVGQQSQALVGLVSNPAVPQRTRAHALTILLHEDPAYGESLRQYVSDSELMMLAAQPLCQVISTMEADPAEAEDLAEALEAVSEEMRPALFAQVEEFRRQVGTPAAVAYEQVLRRPLLAALRPTVYAAMVEEGGNDAIHRMEELRGEETDAARRRVLQGSLLRLRTRTLEGLCRGTGPASAYVSSCDGQGAFFVLGRRDNPSGRCTLAMLCVRAAGDVRDGYVVPGQAPEQVERLLRKFADDASTEFVQVPVEQATPLVQQAVARTLGMGMAVPLDAVPALRFFERTPAAVAPPPSPGSSDPLPRPTRTALRKLMRRPAYHRSWFFDEGDLAHAGVGDLPRSPRRTTQAAWIADTARRLARVPALPERLVAMASHMATWHGLQADAASRALLAAAAQATQADFASSPLVHVLLERTLAVLKPGAEPTGDEADAAPGDSEGEDGGPPELADELADELTAARGSAATAGPRMPPTPKMVDPARRQFLKARFFADVMTPKGRDLALLDLTEATLVALQSSLDLLPSDRQPREEHQHAAAHGIATVFRDYLLSHKRSDIAKLGARFAVVLQKTCHLPPALCDSLGRALLRSGATFVDEVCHRCPVGCLERPRAGMSAEFFSPEHPALH
jgi:hypothetical protein